MFSHVFALIFIIKSELLYIFSSESGRLLVAGEGFQENIRLAANECKSMKIGTEGL